VVTRRPFASSAANGAGGERAWRSPRERPTDKTVGLAAGTSRCDSWTRCRGDHGYLTADALPIIPARAGGVTAASPRRPFAISPSSLTADRHACTSRCYSGGLDAVAVAVI